MEREAMENYQSYNGMERMQYTTPFLLVLSDGYYTQSDVSDFGW